VNNASALVKKLPNTPVRSALIHELTLGVAVTKAAKVLDMPHSSISRASEYCDRPFVEFLRQLGFPRANRAASHQFLLSWLGDDLNCPIPSGANKRCFVGSADLMWSLYAAASLANSIAPLHPLTFEEVRKRERVGLREGDIFINRDEVELAELQALDATAQTEEVVGRIAELELNLAFCKERKKHYRETHQALQSQPKKMVVTIDFTATQTGMQDKFTSFVAVVCTDLPLPIPPELASATVKPVEPQSLKKVVKPKLEKAKRRTKKQVKESGGGRKLKKSWNQDKAKIARAPKMPQVEPTGVKYKPCSTVFHFVVKRTEETPGQISPYVQWAMNFLFETHGLADGFDEVHLFSDGCGKHFKTYPTHWYAL
jgi:hypothetical protein